MMTAEQSDYTKPSRGLDAEIHVSLFRRAISFKDGLLFDLNDSAERNEIPRYSSDIDAAMLVADKMLADGYQSLLTSAVAGDHCAEFCHVDCIRRGRYSSDSRAVVICVAALKARGVIE